MRLCKRGKSPLLLKPGFHWRRKHKRKHKSAYFGVEPTQGSKVFLFPVLALMLGFSACACVTVGFHLTLMPALTLALVLAHASLVKTRL